MSDPAMTSDAELVQDLRAHAHEAPAVCAALMRSAAAALERRQRIVAIADRVRASSDRTTERHHQVKGATCS